MHIFQRCSILFLRILFLFTVLHFQPTLALAEKDSRPNTSMPSLTCEDLKGNIYQNGKNEELRRQAKLTEWNRYHDYIIGGLCDGAMEDLHNMLDQGYLSLADVKAVAGVLGKEYNASSRTGNGKLYQKIREGLLSRNLCSACASNLADEYVKQPNGHVKKLIDDALNGDQKALSELQQLPSSTPLTPQTDSAPTFWSKVAGGIATLAILALYLGVIVILGLGVFSKRFRAWLKTLDARLQAHNINYKKLAAILGAVCVAGVIFSDSRTPQERACAEDWRQCQDNKQLIDTGSHHIHMVSACERAASKKAKYGKPEFPTYSFSNYKPGRDYIETGVVFLVERDALFQNAFGTQVHTEVTCGYDLNRDAVQDVVIWD